MENTRDKIISLKERLDKIDGDKLSEDEKKRIQELSEDVDLAYEQYIIGRNVQSKTQNINDILDNADYINEYENNIEERGARVA